MVTRFRDRVRQRPGLVQLVMGLMRLRRSSANCCCRVAAQHGPDGTDDYW
jgi:hypothetical protein